MELAPKPFFGKQYEPIQDFLEMFELWADCVEIDRGSQRYALLLPCFLRDGAKAWFRTQKEAIKTDYGKLKAAIMTRYLPHEVFKFRSLSVSSPAVAKIATLQKPFNQANQVTADSKYGGTSSDEALDGIAPLLEMHIEDPLRGSVNSRTEEFVEPCCPALLIAEVGAASPSQHSGETLFEDSEAVDRSINFQEEPHNNAEWFEDCWYDASEMVVDSVVYTPNSLLEIVVQKASIVENDERDGLNTVEDARAASDVLFTPNKEDQIQSDCEGATTSFPHPDFSLKRQLLTCDCTVNEDYSVSAAQSVENRQLTDVESLPKQGLQPQKAGVKFGSWSVFLLWLACHHYDLLPQKKSKSRSSSDQPILGQIQCSGLQYLGAPKCVRRKFQSLRARKDAKIKSSTIQTVSAYRRRAMA